MTNEQFLKNLKLSASSFKDILLSIVFGVSTTVVCSSIILFSSHMIFFLSLSVTHDDVDNTITDLTVKFFLHLFLEGDNFFNLCVFFKRKTYIYPYGISAFLGVYWMELRISVIIIGQYAQYLHLLLFRKCLICQFV